LLLEGRIGAKKVLAIFLISGIIVNIFTVYPSSLGASGAIYAIIGTLAVLRPLMVIWVSYIPMPMAIAALFWLAQDIIRTLIPSNIGSIAHMGGLGLGIIAGFYLRLKGYGDKLKFEKRKHDPELERQLDDWEKENMNL
jgi:membrane associated rhomboid family serine protease